MGKLRWCQSLLELEVSFRATSMALTICSSWLFPVPRCFLPVTGKDLLFLSTTPELLLHLSMVRADF